jgi:hypothetical protein
LIKIFEILSQITENENKYRQNARLKREKGYGNIHIKIEIAGTGQTGRERQGCKEKSAAVLRFTVRYGGTIWNARQ